MQSVIQEIGITSLGIANGKLTVTSTEVYKNRRISENPSTNNLNAAISALHASSTAVAFAAANSMVLPDQYPFTGISPEPPTVASLSIARTSTEFVLEFDMPSLISNLAAGIINFMSMANQTMLNPDLDTLDLYHADNTNGGLYTLIGTVSIDQNKTVFLVQNIIQTNNSGSGQ